jgi:signal transduction histidine kinase
VTWTAADPSSPNDADVLEVPLLHEFLTRHHDEIVDAARARLLARTAPRATEAELRDGIPLFLRQLEAILRREQDTPERPAGSAEVGAPSEMGESASRRGGELRHAGFSIAQVVQGYGDICQAITQLSDELQAPITADEFRTLNRCLDEVIAEAVTEFARQRDRSVASENTERLGVFAHELRNLLNNAVLAYEALKTGTVGIASNTGMMLGRSLIGLRNLIDRSLAEVRIEAGTNLRERVPLAEFMEEVELAATIEASAHDHDLAVHPVDRRVAIDVDRQLLGAALGNLLQNAFKFTRPHGRVVLRTDTATLPDRVLIEVEDECGGLPSGFADNLFQPFRQRGADRSGLGLGLIIARQGVEANGGALRVSDLPGKGCVFTVDIPRAHQPAGADSRPTTEAALRP